VEHEGARIAWKAWGERGAPGVILVHGGTAHKGWWDAIGPLLAREGRRVVAPDLPGMGESDWREAYTMDDHAASARAAGWTAARSRRVRRCSPAIALAASPP
jgi:pimeloyl-ACP methyl ester carboxylesterase